MSDRTEADVVAALATANIAPQFRELDGVPLLILKDGAVRSLEAHQANPRRKRCSAAFIEPEAFILYVLTHREPGTLITGDVTETSCTFRAIVDYPHGGEEGTPKWGDHKANLHLQTTPEWTRWMEHNNKTKGQTEFAEYLEDNACDIIQPSGAELLEVALTLQAAKSVNFRQATRLQNGQVQLRYEETLEAKAGTAGQLEIPERFTIEIAPFVGTAKMQIRARLRYRIDQGRLTFFYRLEQPHLVILAAWQTTRAEIEKRTGLIVHRGAAGVNDLKP